MTPATGMFITNNKNTDNNSEEIFLTNSDNHIWPMFKHDSKHTGLSKYDTSGNPGVEKWKFFSNRSLTHAVVIDKDGTLYTGSGWNELYAVYPNGILKWEQKLPSEYPLQLAIGEDETIYLGTSIQFCAYYPNGTLKWILDIAEERHFSGYPSIDTNGTIYAGTADGYLYAIYPNGTIKWENSISGDVRGPALDDQGNIYFTSRDGHVYCLNHDGSLKWMSDRITAFDNGPVIGGDGTIYALPRWDWLFAFNPDGSEKWRKELPYSAGQVSIAPDGTLIVCGRWSGVVAVDPSDGSIIWIYPVEIPVGSSMTNAAIGSDGTIFFGCVNYLCALNPDGTLKWKEHLSTDLFPYMFMRVLGDPSISNDGTVYVTSWFGGEFQEYHDIGYIHAIGMGDPDAPSTPVVSGKNYGLPVLNHWFSIKATSPSDDDIFYMVDWGDGNVEDWAGPYQSDEKIMVKHSWEKPNSQGEYFQVSARAKDTDGLLSPWGEFEIKICFPRNKVIYNPMFLRFLERFPLLERLISLIISD